MNKRGIVYIALGIEWLEHAYRSALSANAQHNNEVEYDDITILTDVSLDRLTSHPPADNITLRSIAHELVRYQALHASCQAAYLKTQLYRLSPYDATLYLDVDTRFKNPYRTIWDANRQINLSKAFNALLCTPLHLTSGEAYSTILSLDASFIELNTGVFLFYKNTNIKPLFYDWFKEWQRFQGAENMAFNRVASNSNYDVGVLDSKYNEYYPLANADSIIVHYAGQYKKHLNDYDNTKRTTK
jgi:hypothetical protein